MAKRALLSVAAAVCAVIVLAGCTGDASPDDGASFTLPSTPRPTATGLPDASNIEDWAALALPEDRAGGPAAVLRHVAAIDEAGAIIDISQAEGTWDLLLTCQSADASPITWHIDSINATTPPATPLNCASPTAGIPTTTVITFDGPGASLELTATNDAVYALEVRPHVTPLD